MLSRYDTLAATAARNAPGTLSVDHYDPFFEAKLKYKDGTPTFKLTDAENNEIANVEKGSIITAQISYPSLWLSNTGFGLNSKLVSAVILPPVNSNISSYAIVDEM